MYIATRNRTGLMYLGNLKTQKLADFKPQFRLIFRQPRDNYGRKRWKLTSLKQSEKAAQPHDEHDTVEPINKKTTLKTMDPSEISFLYDSGL